MLTQWIWWFGIAVEVVLLIRGVQTKLAYRYKFFYLYILSVLAEDVIRLLVHHSAPHHYQSVYWITEFAALVAGCGVAYEIYRTGLAAYPGTARMARGAIVFLFGLVLAKSFFSAAGNPGWWLVASGPDFELNLRVIQAVLIAALVALFLGYSIPFGKNLKGMLVAYGLVVASRVIRLSSRSLGWGAFHDFESYVSPISYDLALMLWVVCLWTYEPVPEARMPMRLEDDYQRIAERTQRQLSAARGYLGRAVRS